MPPDRDCSPRARGFGASFRGMFPPEVVAALRASAESGQGARQFISSRASCGAAPWRPSAPFLALAAIAAAVFALR